MATSKSSEKLCFLENYYSKSKRKFRNFSSRGIQFPLYRVFRRTDRETEGYTDRRTDGHTTDGQTDRILRVMGVSQNFTYIRRILHAFKSLVRFRK